MCSRYGALAEYAILQSDIPVELPDFKVSPADGVIYPHKPGIVIVHSTKQNKNIIRAMNFSLIPNWSREIRPKFATHNARIETVLEKPTWKEPFKKNHCLVPMPYFIESVREGDFAGSNISLANADGSLLYAAGIYDFWKNPEDGNLVESFSILTKDPTDQIIKAGHDRSPIFLEKDSFQEWLNPNPQKDWLSWIPSHILDVTFEIREISKLKA